MCGRYAITCDVETLYDVFAPQLPAAGRAPGALVGLAPHYNIAPTAQVPIVRAVGEPGWDLVAARWGLIPFWAADRGVGGRMFNARAETVASKPAFRQAFARRRALVPASGYFEWQVLSAGVRAGKQPYYIAPADGSMLAFAGLWESWRDERGACVLSTCIVTAPARGALAQVHDRMPVIVPGADYAAWLDERTSVGDLHQLAVGPDNVLLAELEVRPVSSDVGNVRNDYPELLDRLEPEVCRRLN